MGWRDKQACRALDKHHGRERVTEGLGRIPIQRRTGAERFTDGNSDLGFDLLGFWQWATSDLIGNTVRGVVAEYLIAHALTIDVSGARDGWAAYDLCTRDGCRVEVKSAAYLQSWAQSKPSRVTFVTPKTRAWNPDTNELEIEPRRQANVYVFALLAHQDKVSLNPLDASQWEFYVVATSVLNARTRSQHSITLASLQRLGRSVKYRELAAAVDDAFRSSRGTAQQ